MAVLPDGSMLVTERAGRLRMIKGGSLVPQAIAGVPALHTGSQAGLFDIVLPPEFRTEPHRLPDLCGRYEGRQWHARSRVPGSTAAHFGT